MSPVFTSGSQPDEAAAKRTRPQVPSDNNEFVGASGDDEALEQVLKKSMTEARKRRAPEDAGHSSKRRRPKTSYADQCDSQDDDDSDDAHCE
jgi:hypothetical protein